MEPATTEPPVLELLEVSIDPPAPPPAKAEPPARRLVLVIGLIAALLAGVGFLVLRPDAGAASEALATPLLDTAPAPMPPPGIEGFAEMYVASYVTGEGGVPLRLFYAAAPDAAAPTAKRFVRHIGTISVAAASVDGWRVRVAADVLVHDGVGYQPQGVQHFVVGVVATATGFAATGLPVLLPAPPPAPIPAGRSMAAIDDPALLALVDGFLSAYLTGVGDLRAFVEPNAGIGAITPAPFERIALETLQGATGDDGTIWLRALATAEDRHGALAVEHHLVVTGAGGTWAVQRLETGGPPLPSG